MSESKLQVRIEEVIIGALAGAVAGLGASMPIIAGIHWAWPAPDFWTAWREAFAGTMSLAGAAVLGYMAANQPEIDHRRGVRYHSNPVQAQRALQAQESALMSQEQRKGEVRGVEIGGVELSRKREAGHIYCAGLPGGGKTVLLSSIINQVRARGDKLLIHDPKGDYTAKLPPADVVLLGPWDSRAAIWDVSQDMDSPARAQEFSRIVIGEGGARGENSFFYNSARSLLAALIRSMSPRWTWLDLYKILLGDPARMVKLAAQVDPQIQSLFSSFFTGGKDVSSAEKNILSTLAERTSWIANMAAVDTPERERFSLRSWLLGGDAKTVILNNNANFSSAAEPLFGAILAVVAAAVASADMPEVGADARGLWCILDELPQLGRDAFPSVQKIEELGRSRGVRVVRAVQDESQLAALVGKEKALPMLNMQGARIYCKVSDFTAHAISQRLGEREIIRYSTTAQSGAIAGKTATPDRQQVINPSDLMGLAITDKGPEIIVQIGDVMGKLVQPFPPQGDAAEPQFLESPQWRDGPQFQQPAQEPEQGEQDQERIEEPAMEWLTPKTESDEAPQGEAQAENGEPAEPNKAEDANNPF